MHGEIKSVGLPPERHADRVVGEIMREFARKHATLWDELTNVITKCKGGAGSPRAQHRLGDRIKRAGAYYAKVHPGKRGKFLIQIYDFVGHDPSRDEEIRFGDPIPEKPWIACNISLLQSPGGGRNTIEIDSRPLVFITHHCLSRVAQRLGARTARHLMIATQEIFNACIKFLGEKDDVHAFLNAPPQGWRLPLPAISGNVFVVLQRHTKRKALVAATVLD